MGGERIVIDKCFNPACGRELHYLRDGRVVRILRGEGDDLSVEHYWLCGPCFHEYDFAFPATGTVAIRPRPQGNPDEEHIREIFLKTR